MLFPLLAALACLPAALPDPRTCSLDTPTLSPASGVPGDEIVVTVQPLTEVWDTVVTVGAERADVLEIDRSTCEECDDCRTDAGCSTCDRCETCDSACETCEQSLTFIVPELAAGDWSVDIVNRHGRSEPVVLTVGTAPAP